MAEKEIVSVIRRTFLNDVACILQNEYLTWIFFNIKDDIFFYSEVQQKLQNEPHF